MIVVPVNPNAIQVGMVKVGCLKTEFSSAYPARLNGIISQNEFRESIVNINRQISVRKYQILCIVVFGVCLIGGLVLNITGAFISAKNHSVPFVILIGIGAGMIGFGMIFFSVGWFIIRIRRTSKMRKAIHEESKKYLIISTWTLNVKRIRSGYGRYRSILYFYHIIIHIRQPGVPTENVNLNRNQVVLRPTSTVRPQNYTPPPPYPGSSAAFCSQCGAARSNLTANFCSSCGQQFNKY